MKPAQIRIACGVMIALAVVGWSWSFDQRKRNGQLQATLAQIISQRDKLAQLRPPSTTVVRQQQAEQLADKERVRRAAAGFGSDARNLAEALGRMKALCVAAGLAECQARRAVGTGASAAAQWLEPRSATAPGGGASGPTRLAQTEKRLTPYPLTVLATFSPKGLGDLLHRLQSLDMLYRLDRVLIAQNRMELDVVFLHSDEVRPDVQRPAQHLALHTEGASR